jgi:peptidoglycan/xylan/chitin deacetylase (PgdA/CDA1 family)
MIYSHLRSTIGYIISLFLISSGKVSKILSRTLNGEIILSIYFHNPTKKTFVDIIKYLEKKGLHFISAEELIEIVEKKSKFPKGAVFVSIDDGWKNNIANIFETEQGKKIPITLFVSMEPIINKNGFWWSYIDKAESMGISIPKKEILKKLNNRERLKEVEKVKSLITINSEAINTKELRKYSKKNITIGSHTYSHPILTNCNEDEMSYEIGESKFIIESNIKNEIKYFAYPNGKHRKREIQCVEYYGYKAAFGTDPEYIKNGKLINKFNIPRFEISDNVSFLENICRLTGVWYSLKINKRDNA